MDLDIKISSNLSKAQGKVDPRSSPSKVIQDRSSRDGDVPNIPDTPCVRRKSKYLALQRDTIDKADADLPTKTLTRTPSSTPAVDEDLEFGNPRKIIITIILMPVLVFTINAACNKSACTVLALPEYPSRLGNYFDLTSCKIYLGWLAFHVVAYWVIPGKFVLGQPTPSGKRFRVLCLTLALFACGLLVGVHFAALYDSMFALMTTATVMALVLSVYLYVRAEGVPDGERSECGNTGYALYDFYLGRELNPRLCLLDLKYLCELRPGLIGWLVLDLVYLARTQEVLGQIQASQMVVTVCHAIYVIDALYYEESVLTTLDITREGFGFMLVFGDLVWVPFLFSLHGRFLLEHPQGWSHTALVCILILNCFGYWVFRASNNEKDFFRCHPDHYRFNSMRTLSSMTGKALLIDGWWGMCRHPNYLGDLIMALAWTIPCGFQHVLPWFYLLYLLGTLVHRSGRDDKACARKYGDTWNKYCQLVPYKIFPGLY